MKRGWLVILLLSVGMNLGLGYSVIMRNITPESDPAAHRFPETPRDMHPADQDSASLVRMVQERFGHVADRLELTPEQRSTFQQLKLAAVPFIRTNRQQVIRARQLLHAACTAETVSPESVRAYVSQLAHAQGRLDSLVTETLLQEMMLLSPEQRERYLEMMPWERGPGGRFRSGFPDDKPGSGPRHRHRKPHGG
ncbi:MAG: periplasmic heavy metal sensor [bacterium]